ncbi:MAG: hypothetical protein K6B74_02295 [Ruminococcus sp.]|nr:hypothetical protein [Ruminococcus sp.]
MCYRKCKLIPFIAALAVMLSGCAGAETISGREDRNVTAAGTTTPQPENIPETSAETTAETTTTTAPVTTLVTTSEPPENDTYEMIDGFIVAYEGMPQVRAMEPYYFSGETGEYLVSCIDGYADSVGEQTKVWLMMIPSSQEFYTPENIAGEYPSQLKCTKKVYNRLEKAEGVFVNDILEEHKAEYLYSRSDYHWLPLAAFYSARIFAEQAGVPFAGFDTYEAVEREGYLGAFYSVNNIRSLEEFPDTFTYYKPANLDKCKCTMFNTWFSVGDEAELIREDYALGDSYQMVIGTDDCIFEVDTDADNDRVLVIFKDSFGNALLPFLTTSFSKIYVCDNRYFNVNSVDFAKTVGATDVLFALGSASTTDGNKIGLIEQNMYN